MLFASCGGASASGKVVDLPPYPIAADKAVLFLDSYCAGQDSTGFGAFFDQWSNALQPNTGFSSEKEKAAYEVFALVFRPDKVESLGEWEPGGKGIYTGQPYVVLPKELAIEVEGTPDTLRDFRPAVAQSAGKPLYLTAAYDSVLPRFLQGKSEKPVTSESLGRGEWLRKWVLVITKHNEGWYVISHPLVNRIQFDKSLQRATIHFRLGYQFGEAVAVKKGEAWELESSQATAIE